MYTAVVTVAIVFLVPIVRPQVVLRPAAPAGWGKVKFSGAMDGDSYKVHKQFTYTSETVYEVPICPVGNLLNKMYLITNQRLLYMDILGLQYSYFTSDFTLYTVTS